VLGEDNRRRSERVTGDAETHDWGAAPHRRPSCGPVLVVDNDPDDRRLIAGILEHAGYEVREAETGEEALETARKEELGLVVLEVCLPDVSGYSVCRELRDQFGEDLPIIFTSGVRTESFDRVAGFLVGADDYLPEPFARDEFLVRVHRLVRRAARPGSVADSKLARLPSRELEVLRLLAQGLGQKEIATQLFLSPKTVGTHIERIYRKLGVRSRGQAVALAFRDDLIRGAG
jgi:DNA-binding NarL/FixJ family response regulator